MGRTAKVAAIGAAAVAGVIVLSPYVAALGARAAAVGARAAWWASKPTSQILLAETATFTAGILNPGPEDINPGSSLDEVGKLVTQYGSRLLLGKVHVLKEYATKIDEAYHMFKEGFGLGVPSSLSQSNQLLQAMYATMKEGKKIAFDVTDVSIDAAKRGFAAYADADAARQVTEWELSKILRDKELFENTIFHEGGKEVKAADLGLEFIDE